MGFRLIWCLIIGLLLCSGVMASGDIFLCSSVEDCVMYEFVLNGGEPCTNCTVNVTIYNPNGSVNQAGNFTYIDVPGRYRYNAGVLASGYYETNINAYNTSNVSAYSNVNVIEVTLETEQFSWWMIGLIVLFGLFIGFSFWLFSTAYYHVGIVSIFFGLVFLMLAGRVALNISTTLGLIFYRFTLGIFIVYTVLMFLYFIYWGLSWLGKNVFSGNRPQYGSYDQRRNR